MWVGDIQAALVRHLVTVAFFITPVWGSRYTDHVFWIHATCFLPHCYSSIPYHSLAEGMEGG